MDRYRPWIFTSYNLDLKIPDCKFCVYQNEICPSTGKEHLQGYIEFKDKYSMKKVKELFSDDKIHLEVRKGSQKQAISYCTKTETRKPETKPTIIGKVLGQGHRTDLDEIYDDIEEGMTAKEILMRHKGNAIRHISCIKKSLIIYHDLDMVDQYILQKREAENDGTELDKQPEAVIASDRKTYAKYENENWDGH